MDALGHLNPDDVWVAPTASRSVLGYMNDMGYLISRAVAATDVRGGDVMEINRSLQRQLHRTGAGETGYNEPIEAARAWAARGVAGSG